MSLDLDFLRPPEWMVDAACRGTSDPDAFFDGHNMDAVSLCHRCPVRTECATFGADELHGIWGGRTRAERVHVGRCERCRTPMRPKHVPAKAAPGTVKQRRPGICDTCAGKEKPAPMARAAKCIGGCGKRLRPKNSRLDDFPGTVAHAGLSRCHVCYKHHRKENPA